MQPSVPLSRAASEIGDSPISDLMARALACPDVISLAAGFVDHQSLPVAATAQAAANLFGDLLEARRALQYGTTRGDHKLRRRLAERLADSGDAPHGEVDQLQHRLVITAGSQQLLYLLGEALIDSGDIVLVEMPTYFVFLGLLRRFGARTIGIPTDQDGMRLDALEGILTRLEEEGALDRLKIIYTVPEHCNPSGISLAENRRRPLVELVKKWSARRQKTIYLLEDAAYRGLTYESAEPGTLFSHDSDGEHVIHTRTFSKTYSPGIKIGYGVLPPGLLDPVLALKSNHDFGTANLNQLLLEKALSENAYEPHVAELRTLYRRKRDAMLGALARNLHHLRDLVSWTHPKGGLYVWLTTPAEVDLSRDGAVFPRCLEEGVLYVPGDLAFPDEPAPIATNHARLTFGVASEEGIEEGIRRLSVALTDCLQPVG